MYFHIKKKKKRNRKKLSSEIIIHFRQIKTNYSCVGLKNIRFTCSNMVRSFSMGAWSAIVAILTDRKRQARSCNRYTASKCVAIATYMSINVYMHSYTKQLRWVYTSRQPLMENEIEWLVTSSTCDIDLSVPSI